MIALLYHFQIKNTSFLFSLKQKIIIKRTSPKPTGDGSDATEFKAIPSVESATISNASSPVLPEDLHDDASRSHFDDDDDVTSQNRESAMETEDSSRRF